MKLRYLVLLLLSIALCLGCENTIDPFVQADEPFTLWGVISPVADTQKVRVYTIEGEPGTNRPNGIDATVSSTNLTTGEEREWVHREVVYDSGATGHVFVAAFRPVVGESYRIDVVRSDGATSTARVTIPPPVDVTLNLPEVRITGDAPSVIGVTVRYDATNLAPRFVWPLDRPIPPLVEFPVDISYQDELERTNDGWRFEVDLHLDYLRVRRAYVSNCLITDGAPGIQLRNVEIRFIAADSSWYPPNGVFDPDVLVEPTTLSNVENGFGFIGAGHVVTHRWTPPRYLLQVLGYQWEAPCQFADGPRPVPECEDPPIPCIDGHQRNVWTTYF